ncbi:hypothetical protein CSW12_02130 [Bacillus cereus]|nr:hypothetical protein CSW12_02130 [Bacillus cereus]
MCFPFLFDLPIRQNPFSRKAYIKAWDNQFLGAYSFIGTPFIMNTVYCKSSYVMLAALFLMRENIVLHRCIAQLIHRRASIGGDRIS